MIITKKIWKEKYGFVIKIWIYLFLKLKICQLEIENIIFENIINPFKSKNKDLIKKIQEMISLNPDIINKKEKDVIYVISPFKNVAFQLAQELNKIGGILHYW